MKRKFTKHPKSNVNASARLERHRRKIYSALDPEDYIIETDDDFYEYMESFGWDVIDKLKSKYPNYTFDYEQNGQAGLYSNSFSITPPDGETLYVSIPDDDLLEFDNYLDILDYAVDTIEDAI